MTSSISSSSAAPPLARTARRGTSALRLGRTGRALVIVWIFLATFTVLACAGIMVDQRFPLMRAGTPFRAGFAAPHGEWLYGRSRHVPFELDAYLYDHRGTARHIRASDVLFVGNSRALFALRPEVLQPYLDRYGLRGYVLAFNGATFQFAHELIRRYDLRPRLMVLSSDGFFGQPLSRNARAALERPHWASWKYYFEGVASWEVGRRLHLVVPPWRHYVAEREAEVFYRSVWNGAHRIVYGAPDEKPVVTRHASELTAADRQRADNEFPQELAEFRPFAQEMAARGIQLILTVVPYTDGPAAVEVTKRLSQATGVPYVEAWLMGLHSQSGSHMDIESGRQYSEVLAQALLRDPTFRETAGAAR